MTRKDFEFLAQNLSLMLRQNTLTEGGYTYLVSQLDRDYPNFNRDAFEARVAKLR